MKNRVVFLLIGLFLCCGSVSALELCLMSDEYQIRTYLLDIFNSIVIKDIVDRFKIKDLDLFNKIIEYEHSIRDNAHGTCECGNEVELYDEYYGACQCEKCGKWYNLFGQELNPPTYWEEF